MAIVACRECGKEISTDAKACPQCGKTAPSGLGSWTILKWVIFVPIILSIGMCVYTCASVVNLPPVEQPSVSNALANAPTQTPISMAQKVFLTWTYSATKAGMVTAAIDRMASIASSNTVEFGRPYEGAQSGVLTIRRSAGKPIEVLFTIDRGQLICGVQNCVVKMKFDDATARNYPAFDPSDYSTTALFIGNEKAFISAMSKAKVLKIEVTVYQNGSQVFDFPVAGFSMDKFNATMPSQ